MKTINIEGKHTIRARYDEVDQMGYVYHANYVSYCHQARTELMRSLGICDKDIEEVGLMMPVISFDIEYKVPAHYDDEITITTRITELPKVRFTFDFDIHSSGGRLISKAKSSVVFVNKANRKPMPVPEFISKALISRNE